MSIRQEILEQTIGAFQEETEAYHKIWNIALYYPMVMTGAAILQFLAYLCYNHWLHPFKVLVANYQPETDPDPATIELLPIPTDNPGISEGSPNPEDSNDPEEPESPEVSGDDEDNTNGDEACEVIVEAIVSEGSNDNVAK